MPDAPERRYLVSTEQVRGAFVLGGVGAVGLILAILVLATARPQGSYVAVDTSQHEARLAAAAESLSGFEVVGREGARIDIDHAIALVAERGVGSVRGNTDPAAPTDPAAQVDPAASAAAPDGAALYARHCQACHQANGRGIPGAFPPIAGHVGDVVAADRAYPAKLVLFGMMGPIQVNGMAYNGLMPGLAAQLSDAEVAAVLEHVLTAWDDVAVLGDAHTPYTADEVAEWRALGLSMADVYALRSNLDLR